jgi:hypothetical protein
MTSRSLNGNAHSVEHFLLILFGIYVVVAIFSLIAAAKIVSKAGYSGWWVLIIFVPFVGPLIAFVLFCIFAFSEWPIQRQLALAQQRRGGGYDQPPPGSPWTPPSPPGYPPTGYSPPSYPPTGYAPGSYGEAGSGPSTSPSPPTPYPPVIPEQSTPTAPPASDTDDRSNNPPSRFLPRSTPPPPPPNTPPPPAPEDGAT